MLLNRILLVLLYYTFSCEEYNFYQKFLIPSQSYTKEGEVFRTKSPTECLLRCAKRKCINTIIEDEHCQCTTTDCLANRAASNETTSMVECYLSPVSPITTTPICYQGKNSKYAPFKIPYNGDVKYVQLHHLSGGIECGTGSGSYGKSFWGCDHASHVSDQIFTVITNNKNEVLFPTVNGRVHYIHMQGTHINANELTLKPQKPVEVQRGDELRVWHTEDLFKLHERDNSGEHCISVSVKFC
uniref:Uncharacterized protein n=1 Tax=Clytia hemisphaerica TaxID=252671 RepID=A0A7M5V386_9CNID